MSDEPIAPFPLRGVRIWLSGSLPPEANAAQSASLLGFISEFVCLVFRSGGHIIHGAHPSFTPVLLSAAKNHIDAGGRKDCLTLAVSKFWSKDTEHVPIQAWREHCMVNETPEKAGPNARDDSLAILRQWIAARCDAFVAVGGNWWKDVSERAGVPREAGLAIERGVPCFLLGGLGGAARIFVKDNPALIKSLRNGLDEDTNVRIATSENVDELVDQVCRQLSRLPLVQGRVTEGLTFRILALDGGGIKGAFTASVLATLEERLGQKVGEAFDLIAGTSTGGILAIGLGMGLSSKEMLQFYRDRGSVIFPIMRFHRRWRREVRHLLKPKHSQEILMRELKAAYFKGGKERSFGESQVRLLIPAYDAVGGTCHLFRTPHHPLLTADDRTSAAEVALATAAAPTYFSAARVQNLVANAPYFDGGVWANCPAMAAIVEAVCYLGVPLERIDVLSVGTTNEPFTVKMMAQAGFVRWGLTLLNLFQNAQVDAAVQHAQSLVGEPRFLRINITTSPGLYSLDKAKEIENLIALGNKRASDPSTLNQVKSRFLNDVNAMNWWE